MVVDRGGPPDLVEPGETGLIARANDPADFADRVQSLLGDADARRRMGCRGREAAAEHDWSAINGRLLESYRRVLTRYRPPAPK